MHTRTHDTSASAAARMYVARVEPVTKTVNCVNYIIRERERFAENGRQRTYATRTLVAASQVWPRVALFFAYSEGFEASDRHKQVFRVIWPCSVNTFGPNRVHNKQQ